MNQALHKAQETIDKGLNRAHEGAVASTGDYQKADQLKSQHKVEETGTAAAHRVDETLHRAADYVSDKLNPKQTPGQKLDSAINTMKN